MAQDSSTDPLLEDLNPAQREAVLHEKGPLLIVAGAGSGKTRVITHRIAHLIRLGLSAENILAITFTNKAAEEMKERTERLCGIRSSWVSTFHSFAARILRKTIHRLEPYDNSFTIHDAEDSRGIIKEVLAELDVDRSLWTPRAAQEEISRIKNSLTAAEELAFRAGFLKGQKLSEVYARYAERMRGLNAVDFDDLLLLLVRLLETQTDLRERYQDQFQHILIDEFQDTNRLQYQIGRILASRHGNICITGDPDQSIYSWRGADISNILDFETDYPDARVVKLEENYRSVGNILRVANALISHNELRIPKELRTRKADGEPVEILRFVDERVEAREIARAIQGHLDEGIACGDIAVFYRVNAISRTIEQELINAGVPYQIVGAIEFFLRREVKDIVAYLRIIDNPRDSESLKRIINVPGRGIGPASFQKLQAAAMAEGKGVLELMLAGAPGVQLGKRASKGIEDFAGLYRELSEATRGWVEGTVKAIIGRTGYEAFLREEYGEGARDHYENLGELVNDAREFDLRNPEGTITEFLERVQLLAGVDRWDRDDERVTLMTLHSAKGLEFPVVFIAGVEDGILPLLRVEDLEPNYEEERRLLYVGITRARERLYISHCASRMRFGVIRHAYPSRFLSEIKDASGLGEEHLTVTDLAGDAAVSSRSSERRRRRQPEEEEEDGYGPGWETEGWEEPEEPYPVGSRVLHETYGQGEVIRISGMGSRKRVTVSFDDGGEKQFVLGFVGLRRIR